MSGASFLYPFLDSGERDPQDLLTELARSAHEKIDDSRRLIARSLAENEAVLDEAARAITERIESAGRVLTFGNGGSACDALAFVRQLDDLDGVAVRALSLAADPAVLSALSNDIGSELIFARQVEAFGRPDDVAVAFSTSGESANILRALAVARQRGMLTIAFAGYHGGSMTQNSDVDYCIIVGSDSVHRVQEAQTQLASNLCGLLTLVVPGSEERS